MKTKQYVAPCVSPKKNPAITGFLICGGLITTLGGVGTIEQASAATGIIVVIVGLVCMYLGARRIYHP